MRGNGNRALIIGGGRGGSAMLEMLLEEKMIQVAGVVDIVAGAPGMELARAQGVPTFTDLNEALKACEPCMVFNLTGSANVEKELARKKHVGGIMGGVEALMMWRMVTRMQEMRNELYHQAHHDPLTGVYNRRYMLDRLRQGLAEAVRYDMPLSLVLIDLDHFKDINDNFGHAAGDAVLKGVVCVLQQCLRQADILARWGGEEFLVLLPQTDRTQAAMAARKWLEHVSAAPMDLGDGQSGIVTFSAGVAAFNSAWADEGMDRAVDAFLECVDQRLYRAKEAGRNRVADR
ncbi:MAG: GGDEF domain-containing protein [Mariprofundaceae bacterium]|nr:GGDEF domain-containing protein [Mariprofundaceae bacterium]